VWFNPGRGGARRQRAASPSNSDTAIPMQLLSPNLLAVPTRASSVWGC
jgi:hypothetical protein